MRDCNAHGEIPCSITPEILLHGHELVSLNLVPDLQGTPNDPDWSAISKDPVLAVKRNYAKLNKARSALTKIYHEQFIPQLISQAVNEKDRYRPVRHKFISVHDIVLLKEPLLKPSNYPYGHCVPCYKE